MIIDTNAYLGPYAFRRLRHQTPSELLNLMDKKGIDRAMVSSSAAITYRNVQSGNEELAAAIKLHRDRLIPFAVVNPAYAGWQDDLKVCDAEFGMKGIRLYPKWHHFGLADVSCLELIAAATERKMVVSIPIRVEDSRQRSWLVDVPDVPLSEIAVLVKACPNARFVLLNGVAFANSPLGRQAKEKEMPCNYVVEISRLSALLDNEIGQLVELLGPDRVVFGSGMPFNDPDPALLKIEVLAASEEDKEKIRWKNAARLIA